jgi:uncharacterized protein YpmB
MRTPSDFISETHIKFTSSAIELAFYKVIEKAQKEAWNEAIELASRKAEIKYVNQGSGLHGSAMEDLYVKVVDKNSILSLKI